MLRIDKTTKNLIALPRKTMREAGYWERRDIQEMICRSPDAFCDELGEYIHIVGREVAPSEYVQDRIDLIGVDSNGSAVVIELKRDNHKLHLLQTLSYAAMVAQWAPKRFVEELRVFNNTYDYSSSDGGQSFEDAKDALEGILEEEDIDAVNRNQRIVLLAEAFDYEVVATCEWLTKRYDMDIRCYRVAIATNGQDDFLSCTRAYPPPELTEIAIRRKRSRETGEVTAIDWTQAISTLENPAVKSFYEHEVAAGKGKSVQYRTLVFHVAAKRRFVVSGKRIRARVWQNGRFEDDITFWKSRLGDVEGIGPISRGKHLRFYLSSDSDFENFKMAVNKELASVEFSNEAEEDDATELEQSV